jgi:CRISPR-associated protein Cas1
VLSRTVVVGQPAFLSIEDAQLVVAFQEDARRVVAPGLRPGAKGSDHPRVPLEDLGVLVLEGPGIALTKDLLAECAARNVAVVVCDARHLPAAQLVPYEAHTLAGKVFREQLEASLPLKKQVWKQIVQAKLREQARALSPSPQEGRGGRGVRGAQARILALAEKVASGDPENREAQAAAVYFEALFGKEFVRDRDEPGLNAMLNYGYAVMRACVARAIVGTGLHPALSVHHDSQYNAFGLVDDAMEPLRPIVDRQVLAVLGDGPVPDALTPPVKRALLQFLEHDVAVGGKTMPLSVGLGHYAASLKRVLCGKARKVSFPSRLERQAAGA